MQHGLYGESWVSLQYGVFAEPDTTALEDFADGVIDELDPQTPLEHAEAIHIAGLCVRRARLGQFEAMAIGHATTMPGLLPGQAPSVVRETDLTRPARGR